MLCQHQHPRTIEELREITRRQFFDTCGVGVGKIALASLLVGGSRAFAGPATSQAANAPATAPAMRNPLMVKAPHFPAKAKRVIYIFQVGAPSQLDLFDSKPMLVKHDGQPIPAELTKDQRYAFIEKNAALMAGRYKFIKHGKSGIELSEMLPELGKVADDICLIRSMHTDQFNHAPAQLGRPSMGSWVSYGLGSEAADLPGFVVLTSGKGTSGGPSCWGSGFLPTMYQGVNLRAKGDAVLSVTNPKGVDKKLQRESLD